MSTPGNRDALLLFQPVPQQRKRASGWTAEVQRAFIAALAQLGVVSRAARSVGRTARSAYRLRGRAGADGFVAAWDQAMERARHAALGAACTHLFEPERVPVCYRGRIIGWRERTNDRVLLSALRVIHSKPEPPRPVCRPRPDTAATRAEDLAARRACRAIEGAGALDIRIAEARHRYGGPVLWPDDLRTEYRRVHGCWPEAREPRRARSAPAAPTAPPRVRAT